MDRPMAPAGGRGGTASSAGADVAGGPAASRPRRVLMAPFSRRTWAELRYLLASLPLAVAGVAFTLVTTVLYPLLGGVSAPGLRKLGDASRRLARERLGEDVPAPPAAPHQHGGWLGGAARDRNAWRARGYLLLKLPLAVTGLAAAGFCWLGGLILVTFPVWWTLLPPIVATENERVCRRGGQCVTFPVSPGTLHSHHVVLWIGPLHIANLAGSFLLVPFGVALLLAAPWLAHAMTQADRLLIRGLLGPASPADRIRALEETRARAVDDSAARLRGIERDLHDGAQAQLVALAMKLGLAREKLTTADPADRARATQLVDDAHRGVIEAIADLRVLARGIHPPVLDNGLPDALATLAARSGLPVEVVTDIPERPSAAIETIAYFSAAELLTNVAKHSGGRHVSIEAVHVPGLLRIRVSDDGGGGARVAPGGGLAGLADRVRTVDGRLDISSPPGGPTVVTVELPSHA